MDIEGLYGVVTWGLVRVGYSVARVQGSYTLRAERAGKILSVRAGFPPDPAAALSLLEREDTSDGLIHVLVFPKAIINGEVKAVGDVRKVVVFPAESFQERLVKIDDTVLLRSRDQRDFPFEVCNRRRID